MSTWLTSPEIQKSNKIKPYWEKSNIILGFLPKTMKYLKAK